MPREILLLETYVADTDLADRHAVVSARPGDVVTLHRMGGATQEPFAIGVADHAGRHLGYVPSPDNVVLARMLDAGLTLTARVTGARAHGNRVALFISISLVDQEAASRAA